jgi:Rod binding domain-containing protein
MNAVAAVSSLTTAAQAQAPSPKLVKAAQEFEAILLSTWLEKLQGSFAGPDDGSDPAHGTLASMGTQAIASALAARGGLGVAKMLLQHLVKPSETVLTATPQGAEKIFENPKVLSGYSR